MRILCLTKYDRLGASSRLRFLQFIPFLRAHGFEVEVRPIFDNEHIKAAYSKKRRPIDAARALLGRRRALRDIERFDLVWLEGEIFPWIPWWFEKMFRPKNLPLIVDYDDAIFHNYDMHKRWLVRRLLGSKIDRVMNSATCVVAGNAYLAGRAESAEAKSIKIVPTVVNRNVYSVLPDRPKGPVTVGWIGSPSTWSAYLEPMLPIIEPLAKKLGTRLLAVGAYVENHRSLGYVDFEEWNEQSEVAQIQRMDVGIMPLVDSPWARGKCGYKLIQYMACGLPVVASPVGVNVEIVEHGINGFLAETDEDWRRALEILANDHELRDRMGKAGRAKFESNYSLQIQGPRVARIFQDLVGNAAV